MTKKDALNGKPYAGNPHVWFDEGEVASCTAEALLRRVHCRRQPEGRASVCAATSRRGSLLYTFKFNIIPSRIVGGVEIPSMSAKLVLAEAKNSNKDQVQ